MSRENIATSQRLLEEAIGQGRLDVIDEVTTDDYVDHDPLIGESDAAGVKEAIARYREAFPDLEITVDEIFAADDRVVIRWTGSGTFERPFMGKAPSGEKGAPIHGIGIDRFEGEKIAESWGQWNTMQLMKNIGAMPERAGAASG
jgi:predicted ester cyclase